MRSGIRWVIVSILAAVPATYLTAVFYLAAARVEPTLPGTLRLAIPVTLALLPLAFVFAVVIAAALAMLNARFLNVPVTLVLLFVASGGVVFGLTSAGHSPHVSQPYAIASAGAAWTLVAAVVVTIRQRRSITR